MVGPIWCKDPRMGPKDPIGESHKGSGTVDLACSFSIGQNLPGQGCALSRRDRLPHGETYLVRAPKEGSRSLVEVHR
jgi:hypothetical protein